MLAAMYREKIQSKGAVCTQGSSISSTSNLTLGGARGIWLALRSLPMIWIAVSMKPQWQRKGKEGGQ